MVVAATAGVGSAPRFDPGMLNARAIYNVLAPEISLEFRTNGSSAPEVPAGLQCRSAISAIGS